jgi:hypothetical protein
MLKVEILPDICFPDGESGVGIRLSCRSCRRKIVGKYHPLMSGQPYHCPHCGHRQPLSRNEIEQIQCQVDCLLIQAIGGDILPEISFDIE